MCGIFGVLARRDAVPLLLDGLARLEYRGYDSAGLAVLDGDARLRQVKSAGKVEELRRKAAASGICGWPGIAHTRWATHGPPSTANAHPQSCGRRRLALVHNGIIENHETLRRRQLRRGCRFRSGTDTEVIVHELEAFPHNDAGSLPAVAQAAFAKLEGSYALAILEAGRRRLWAARRGSPLLIGLGDGEYYISSDLTALLPLTRRYLVLEEGDLAVLELDAPGPQLYDAAGRPVTRPVAETGLAPADPGKGPHRHHMLKEIREQPAAVHATLSAGMRAGRPLAEAWAQQDTPATKRLLAAVRGVHLVACGTSYHAALIAAHWLEQHTRLPCRVEIASEYRYRPLAVPGQTLFVCISQSGETADTLAALRRARTLDYLALLGICNTSQSALAREVQLLFLTRAGPERGVASTKAFTAQLAALQLLTLLLAEARGRPWKELAEQLPDLPAKLEQTLRLEARIAECAPTLVAARHILFLGRGPLLPVAMEGALKLKEISYLQAECYPAGELKHGPLALVEPGVQVVVPATTGKLLPKLRGNLEEVKARGGQLLLFAGADTGLREQEQVRVIPVPPADDFTAPLVHALPLQMLAYQVALLRGADIDQPRNLAKSVTVE